MIVQVELPWPPSVNHMHKNRKGGGKRLSDEARIFRERAVDHLKRLALPMLTGKMEAWLHYYPPHGVNVRDCDNGEKATLDALERGGLVKNDRLIRTKHTYMHDDEPTAEGMVVVQLEERKPKNGS